MPAKMLLYAPSTNRKGTTTFSNRHCLAAWQPTTRSKVQSFHTDTDGVGETIGASTIHLSAFWFLICFWLFAASRLLQIPSSASLQVYSDCSCGSRVVSISAKTNPCRQLHRTSSKIVIRNQSPNLSLASSYFRSSMLFTVCTRRLVIFEWMGATSSFMPTLICSL